jgi:hypothetical protein
MELISSIADIVGVLGVVFSLLAWLQSRKTNQTLEQERQRQNKRITVRLRNGQDSIELPTELRRAELTRAEILGRIGMIPMKEKGSRYSLGYLSEPEFLRRVNEIASAEHESVLEISCTDEELDQFDLPRIGHSY